MTTAAQTQEEEGELVILHGRGRNALSDTYKLPHDGVELNRLNLQHRSWTLLMGGLYPAEAAPLVEGVIESSTGARARILDLGSGSGIWVSQIAAAFPHADVVGFDLIGKSPAVKEVPSNLTFVKGDLTKGFSDDDLGLPRDFREGFDIVHTRCVIGHLSDPWTGLQTVADCVKPGGLLLYGEGTFTALDEHMRPMGAAEEGADNAGRSWFPAWAAIFVQHLPVKGLYEFTEAVEWYKRSGMVECESVQMREFPAPMGWSGGGRVEHGEELAAITNRILLEWAEGTKPIMIKAGYPLEKMEYAFAQFKREVEDPDTHQFIKSLRLPLSVQFGVWHMYRRSLLHGQFCLLSE